MSWIFKECLSIIKIALRHPVEKKNKQNHKHESYKGENAHRG